MLLLNVVGVDLHALKSVRFPHDYVWHISNVASASKGAFFDDARLAGHVFYYHFFGDLLLGMCKKIFPMVTAFDLVMRCTPLLVSYIFSIGLYALAQNRAKRPLLVCALFYCAGFVIGPLFLVFAGESLKDGARMAIGKEMLPDDALTDILAGWIGIGGFWFLAQEGLSQMYFLFVAILFVSKYCLYAAGRLQGQTVGRVCGSSASRVRTIAGSSTTVPSVSGLSIWMDSAIIEIYEVAIQPD